MKTGFQSVAYLEQLYAEFARDPQSVSPEWRAAFAESDGNGAGTIVQLGPSFRPRSLFHPAEGDGQREVRRDALPTGVSGRLRCLIDAYRERGHLIAAIDPLGSIRPGPPELDPEFYAFTHAELELLVNLATLNSGAPLTVREVIQRLRRIYCRSIGAQFMHLDDAVARDWLLRRFEDLDVPFLSVSERRRILERLIDAAVFEDFLLKKFPGAKTFSLEGSETLLALLDLALEHAGRQGIRHVVIGIAHRGRLNVLAHIVGKEPCEIFREFADTEPELWQGRGDVKYHLGHSGEWTGVDGHTLHVSLCFNPSHLEFVNPVVLGRVRAAQDRLGDRDGRLALALIVHGDAAFAGEGIVQESLNLARLPGYTVAGTLHVIVNNQIGFTTPPAAGRSSVYATDVARMIQAPVFHVNGEDPDAVSRVVRLCLDFRRAFHGDAVIDLYGYRRRGHNETDEPTFTQPQLYRKIRGRPGVDAAYARRLVEEKVVAPDEPAAIGRRVRERLEQAFEQAHTGHCTPPGEPRGLWRNYFGGAEPRDEPETGIAAERLSRLLRQLTKVPAGFHVHPRIERRFQAWREMAEGRRPLDWAAAEALALASLATEGVRVRLTGQDTARGTFSQRHAVLFDQEDGHPFAALQHLEAGQAAVDIYNSPLCEAGALGFEYGYSLDAPNVLVLWEAQFGDFVNAAQVILDQFITSAEEKWRRLCGLVLLLPHGLEGMGPEHSSARLERFLTLAARDNIQVVQPTTPAQYFHVLRRQALWNWRKPLFVLTPKGLLRHPEVVSPADHFVAGKFQRLLPDAVEPGRIKRILLCSGKVYYALAAYRDEHRRGDVALIRLEQLYPLRGELLETTLERFARGTPAVWVQEEPANMGAWRCLHERFGRKWLGRFAFALVSRVESASPATGSAHAHQLEQARLVARAFGDREPDTAEVFKAPDGGHSAGVAHGVSPKSQEE